MSQQRATAPANLTWPIICVVATLMAAVWLLRSEGRLWWCACGRLSLWAGNVCSPDNSQHFLDPYSFTHLLHGVAFFWLLRLLLPQLATRHRFSIAIALESVWEVLENSESVIERFRQATAALGYHGDTVANSLGDIFACGAGFLLAAKLGLRWSLVLFVIVEVILTLWIRDSLLLEILMLVYPLEAIKLWQLCPN